MGLAKSDLLENAAVCAPDLSGTRRGFAQPGRSGGGVPLVAAGRFMPDIASKIKKVAVIGAGVMGGGIAAQMADAGVAVLLLDLVPAGAANRNALAEAAVKTQREASPPGFVYPSRAGFIICGNLEDDLGKLRDCDWIIEAVKEDIRIKQDVYRKIDANRKSGSIVSSNTSTLPLRELSAGMPECFTRDFMITHFFNPPRFTQLLEAVDSDVMRPGAAAGIVRFAELSLGKTVLRCKDTPGFIANRIGGYWMMRGLEEAVRQGVPLERADAAMGAPAGFPRTGIFGLFDRVGIDLLLHTASAITASPALPADDPLRKLDREKTLALLGRMIEQGYSGRKGKGGFYRLNTESGQKIKEVRDLATGEYHPAGRRAELNGLEPATEDIKALVMHHEAGRYAWAVLSDTLCYAVSLVPAIALGIAIVDLAMKKGYNWKHGPFEMIDKLGVNWFIGKLEEEGRAVPHLLEAARGESFYITDGGKRLALGGDGKYTPVVTPEGYLTLEDVKRGAPAPLASNKDASLWDMGDEIACLELTTKENVITPDVVKLIGETIQLGTDQRFKGLVIGNDTETFSAGADLGLLRAAAQPTQRNWTQIDAAIKAGQNAMQGLKYARFPVVSALAGKALGGGCELLLHSDAIQAHANSFPGLVEPAVGLVPAWGGCTQTLMRQSFPVVRHVPGVFQNIARCRVANSLDEARDMKILRASDGITMNRARLLADAKARCLELTRDYSPPKPRSVHLPGAMLKRIIDARADALARKGKITGHDAVVSRVLSTVLCGGNTNMTRAVGEQQLLELERAAFMELVKTEATFKRIDHMVEHGKPFREPIATVCDSRGQQQAKVNRRPSA
jgi:3-hydroxyacyl-CoA dehydrogenase